MPQWLSLVSCTVPRNVPWTLMLCQQDSIRRPATFWASQLLQCVLQKNINHAGRMVKECRVIVSIVGKYLFFMFCNPFSSFRAKAMTSCHLGKQFLLFEHENKNSNYSVGIMLQYANDHDTPGTGVELILRAQNDPLVANVIWWGFFRVINEKDGEDKRWRDRKRGNGGRVIVTNRLGVLQNNTGR